MADKPQSNYNEVLAGIGDIEAITVFGNEILIATYIRPNVSKGGIILTDKTVSEDQWQGKVGVVVKQGPLAFVNNDRLGVDFMGQSVNDGDLIVYRVSDGFPLDINGIHCRLMQDTEIRMTVTDPGIIY